VAYFGDDADNVNNTADETMNFELGAGAPLDMTFSVAACASANSGWSGDPVEFTTATTLTLFQFVNTIDEYAAGAAPICHPETTVELTIPNRSTVPAGAGERYSWDGPVITFSSTPSS
jgi:hypothetical protein